MAKFEYTSVFDALNRSIRNAKHLSAKDSATVATARVLAARIDSIAKNGFTDENGKLDNVTVPTFLKYLQALGLTSAIVEKPSGKSKAKTADPLSAFKQRHAT
ncbi:hypothetical protein OZX73_05400 [Bifidobacterium sp. ESL0775]|uniref:terminase small subunit n=1 Tax=Bifidobacterium sp. ESL0775 TaxID=2983230 RepID=UPI0023F6A0B4|nr:hypothetical protein [Bifidobacterium sp. ESL0775]WEV68728.1 hypothetical protein OZX73_05400 [Bifidobacterium sp. ESL0775]